MATELLDRRRVVQLLLALPLAASNVGALPRSESEEEWLDAEALKDLAKEYRKQARDDAGGIAETLELIRSSWGEGLNDQVVQALRAQMRSDFEAGTLVELYGWRVTRTEARVLSAAAELVV